jgi:hypothetical protein
MSIDLEKKEDEYINQITLKYLTNLDYQNDSNEISQTNNMFNGKHFKKIYKNKEKKFYKKRILNIFKLLLNDDSRENREKNIDTKNEELLETNKTEENELLFPDIKITFDVFIKTCINYLKAQDKCDIIQDDYKNLDIYDEISGEKEYSNIDNSDLNKQINCLMMRKILKKKNLIDSFVKKTPLELNISNPIQEINKIIPHKKKINLNDPELKIKGLVQPNNLDENMNKNMNKNKNNTIYKEEIINKNDENKEKCKEKNKKKLKVPKDHKE